MPLPEITVKVKRTYWYVCADCGFVANHLMCLKRYGARSIKPAFDVSTVKQGKCECCDKEGTVVPVRDFFYPPDRAFNYIRRYILTGKD